jgi:ATP-dependent Lon protease
MSGDNKKIGINPQRENENSRPAEKHLVLARDILPDHLPVIPIFSRPVFPKMIVPLVIDDPRGKKAVQEVLPAHVRRGIKIHFVDTFDDVVRLCFA